MLSLYLFYHLIILSFFCFIVTNDEVTHFWSVFSPLDREGIGLIRRDDFFAKIVEEPRTFFGDSIFDFIDCDAHDVITFGEYVEAICIFCLFERNDVLRCKYLLLLFSLLLLLLF